MLKKEVLERIVSFKERLSGTPESKEVITKIATRLINVLGLTEESGLTDLNECLEVTNKLEREHYRCRSLPPGTEMEEAFRNQMFRLILATIQYETRKHIQ